MKTTLFLATYLTCFFYCSAQKERHILHDLTESYWQSSSQKMKTIPKPQLIKSYSAEGDNWKINDSSILSYNQKGFIISELRFSESTQYLMKYTYDIEDRVILRTTVWRANDAEPWSLDSAKKATTYDQAGNETELIYSYYSQIDDTWNIDFGNNYFYEYNTNNQPVQIVSQYFNGEEYSYNYKELLEYDSTGKLVSEKTQSWNEELDSFVNYFSETNIVWYKWNNDYKKSLKSSSIISSWQDSVYAPLRQYFYFYDSHENKIEVRENIWYEDRWTLHVQNRELLTYNSLDALSQRIGQTQWGADTTIWRNGFKFTYDNFVNYTAINNIDYPYSELTIIPNPFSDKTTISTGINDGVFTMFDLTGKCVQIIDITSENTVIEKENLQSGMYFYHVTRNQQTIASGKISVD